MPVAGRAGIEHKVAGHDREGAGTDADTGITGLAMLACLANGQTHLEGKYRKNVQRGLEFLLRSQAADGNLAGSARLYARMYCHGMASLALSEALALTGDVRIRPYVERAVRVHRQRPASDHGRLAVSAGRSGRHESVWLASDGAQERVAGRHPDPAARRAKACCTSCSDANRDAMAGCAAIGPVHPPRAR